MSNSRHTVKAALRDMRVHYKAYKVGKFWVYSAIVLATLAGGLGGTITAVSAATEPIAIQASATMDKTTTSQSSPDAQTAPQSTQADETTPVASTTSAATGEASGTSTSTPADLEKVASAASTPAVSSNLSASELTAKVTSTLMVSAQTLANATGDGPFTAGVNQVIPLEAFGGDGMLTRLLLTSAASAPWSDNGTGANAALSPVMGLASGQYFYEVDLAGNVAGKQGQALLDQLRLNGTQTYSATVKLYAAGADGQADTSKVIATKAGIQLNVEGLTSNIKNQINVPAAYLVAAKGDGPFTAGVNQVIPFEAFGGDGMLTRLLLSGSNLAAWSNNGTAMNKPILPISGLAKGEYAYSVVLGGNLAGKTGQALIDQLRKNGTQTYGATVTIYAIGSDGKAITTSPVATKAGVQITINVPEKAMTTPGQSKGDQSAAMSKPSGHGASTGKMAAMTAPAKSGMTTKTGSDTAMKPAMMQKAADKSSQMSSQMPFEKLLPQAGDAVNEGLTLFGTAMLALLAVVGTTVGINSKRRAG
uniref:SSURE domain-containing protein n=1 Tax=Lacticaseibacillus mingshuiensis TaxID=2799574 RepID=UPI0019524EBB|nr:fibronectin-binding SSURE repeat-containing protein [Lacticaseibacillus mingshuiensis]